MTKTKGIIASQPPAFKLMALGQLGTGFATYAAAAIMILYLYEPMHLGGLGVDRITATQIMALFTSLGYFAGIAGSYAADRLVGLRKPYLYGTLLNILAILLLAVPHGGLKLFLTSLAMQIFASGVTGQSLNALVSLLYRHNGGQRNTAFTILYIMNNVGAAGPFITGTVAVTFGYNAGFLVAAMVLALTTIPYLIFSHRCFGDLGMNAPDLMTPRQRHRLGHQVAFMVLVVIMLTGMLVRLDWLSASNISDSVGIIGIALTAGYVIKIVRSPKITPREAHRVKGYSIFLIGNSLSMLIASQATGILSIYTLDHVNLSLWGMQLSAASFQTIPAILAVVFGSLISEVWRYLGNRQPSANLKYGIGLLLWGAAPLLMILPLTLVSATAKASPLWIVVFDILMVAGESLTSPIGTAMASTVAPAIFVTQMMTVFTLSKAAGSGLAAIAANFYTPGHEVYYFLIIGGAAIFWGIFMLSRPHTGDDD